MKLQPARRRGTSGSVLMVTLFAAVLLGLTLGSYLYLVHAQNISVFRSQAWNGALAMAEAGVEEALAQLNQDGPPGPGGVNLSANGWGPPAGGTYGPVSRSLASGSYSVSYATNVANPRPIIVSTGYVQVPAISATLCRVVQVTTTNTPLFSVAMATKYNIDLKGNPISTDSFDSADTNHSTGGRYDFSKRKYNGDVASISGLVNVSSAHIHGKLWLGPAAPTNLGPHGAASGGIFNDFNVDFPDVVLASTVSNWLPAQPRDTNIDGTTYNYVFQSQSGEDYTISTPGSVYVGTNTNVRLVINESNFSLGAIRVAGAGINAGNLIIYMTGQSLTLDGNTIVESGNATNLRYFGLPGNTSITISGNTNFTGTIYAPSADLTLNSGGSDPCDFVGSSVTKKVILNGHFKFHFDENLLRVGPTRGYLAVSWKEL